CQIVRSVMGGMPGCLLEQTWSDFAANRNAVLDAARALFPEADYALTIDADEILTNVGPSILGESDAYTLDVEYGTLRYRRTALFRLDKPFRWRGVVHEFLHCDEPYTTGHLTAPTVRVFHEGARSRDPETYRKDAALL